MIGKLAVSALSSRKAFAKACGLGTLAALDYVDTGIGVAGSVVGGVWAGIMTSLLTSATGNPPLAATAGVLAWGATTIVGLRQTFKAHAEHAAERQQIAEEIIREASEGEGKTEKPLATTFSEAGQTTRTLRPKVLHRPIEAANDLARKARNAWGEGPLAAPVPA